MPYGMIIIALCVMLISGERANAQNSLPLLTKEACARLEATFYARPHRADERWFYESDEYLQCREAAFAMEPNAGLEILNALTGEGAGLDLMSDIQQLEQRLFYATVNGTQSLPQYMQCCYEIKNAQRCGGFFADDSEHFDALIFEPLTLRTGKAEPLVLHTNKPAYVLQSLFFNGQAVPFTQTGQARWEAVLPAERTSRHGVHILNAIFAWNGTGPEHSLSGTFRKAVWYYESAE